MTYREYNEKKTCLLNLVIAEMTKSSQTKSYWRVISSQLLGCGCDIQTKQSRTSQPPVAHKPCLHSGISILIRWHTQCQCQ